MGLSSTPMKPSDQRPDMPITITATDAGFHFLDAVGGEVAPDEVDGIRAMVRAAGGVDAAREVAIAEATKANEVLHAATALDPAVTGGMIRLVEGLIDRTS
mgnify:CR=1 FL=1